MINFWVAVLVVSILIYVLLDGFDLGVGIIFGFMPNEARRLSLLQAIEPLWDGNETWLVVTGVVLWGAFPIVYATLLSAFYLPLLAMLGGLILRGVAFEFRDKTEKLRWVWDGGFALGSLVAAFVQGAAVGALVEGLPISNGQYAGGDFGWFSPFALLCGMGSECRLRVARRRLACLQMRGRAQEHCVPSHSSSLRWSALLSSCRLCPRAEHEPRGHGALDGAADSVPFSHGQRRGRHFCWERALGNAGTQVRSSPSPSFSCRRSGRSRCRSGLTRFLCHHHRPGGGAPRKAVVHVLSEQDCSSFP